MKRILFTTLFVAALFFSTDTLAQDRKAELGVKAGVNISEFGGDGGHFNTKVGFHVGVTLDYEFVSRTYLMTGLNFTTKGAKLEDVTYTDQSGAIMGRGFTCNPMYLELPIHIGYKLNVADDVKLVFRGGPYLAYGIAGKISIKDGSWPEGTNDNVFQDAFFKRFDFGVGLGVGMEYKKYTFNISYDHGLINVRDMEDLKFKNRNLSVGLGYKF